VKVILLVKRYSRLLVISTDTTYLSITQMMGATNAEADAALTASAPNRTPRFEVFHLAIFSGSKGPLGSLGTETSEGLGNDIC
jgi:hypothetical protein